MESVDNAKAEGPNTAPNRGEQLDEAIERVGDALKDKVTPVADNVADKVVDVTGGLPDRGEDEDATA